MRRLAWLLTILVLSPGAWADDWEVFPQQGIQTFRGLDDTSAPTNVENGRAQDVQNVLLESGSIRKRYGLSVVGDTADIPDEAFCAVTGLYYTKFSSGTERIVRTCGNRFEYLSGSDWTLVGHTGAVITAGQNNQFVWTVALDNIIGTNGVDVPIQWAGGAANTLNTVSFTGLSAGSTPSRAKTVIFFKNFLIFGNTTEGGTARPTRFRWSNVGTINTWTDADFIDIGALGGQEINAMAELYDNLYIFLTDSIYKVSFVGGADTFQVSKVTDDIGSIAKNSVQSITLANAQNGLMFLDKDKRIYFFNGVIAQDVTGLIETTMSGLSGSRLQYAVSADTNDSYVLCVTNGTASANNLCLDFEYTLGEWTKHTNIPANAMAHVLDNNAADQTYLGTYHSLTYEYLDEDLKNDVGSATGTIDAVNTYTTSTASGLLVLYDTGLSLTADALIGAPIELVGGTGSGQTNTIVSNTTTGLVVADTFTTTPSTDTTYEVGAIDAFYTTKWYDFADPARLKHFGEVYFWADADVSSTHSLTYATDFSTDVETLSISLASSESDAIWGSAIWGVSLWGSGDNVFREGKQQAQGRYLRMKFADDDPDESFHIYGFSQLYQAGDTN